MNMTTTSFGRRTRRASLETWVAIAGLLIGAGSLAACGPAGAAMDRDGGAMSADGGGLTGSDASVPQPDGGGIADVGAAPASRDGGVVPSSANASCTIAAQCASGFCVDGVCCDAACDGSCESCAQTGKVGTCAPVKNASDDGCGGDSICDAASACRTALGKACTTSNECASDSCVDGVCCGSTVCGECQSCAVPGSEGTCAPVAKYTDDADTKCSGVGTCDGVGGCRAKNGTMCAGDAECTSLHCVDGVCCNQACDGTCYSCDLQGSAGTCMPIDGAEDLTKGLCGGKWICTAPAGATPACKIRDGGPCATDADCVNGVCLTSYRDGDGDGFGGAQVSRCERAPAAGYVLVAGDCCDSDPGTHPGVTTFDHVENACGGFDRNCDGKVQRHDGSDAPCGCKQRPNGGPAVCIYCW
jgi:hypothetical protein